MTPYKLTCNRPRPQAGIPTCSRQTHKQEPGTVFFLLMKHGHFVRSQTGVRHLPHTDTLWTRVWNSNPKCPIFLILFRLDTLIKNAPDTFRRSTSPACGTHTCSRHTHKQKSVLVLKSLSLKKKKKNKKST